MGVLIMFLIVFIVIEVSNTVVYGWFLKIPVSGKVDYGKIYVNPLDNNIITGVLDGEYLYKHISFLSRYYFEDSGRVLRFSKAHFAIKRLYKTLEKREEKKKLNFNL